MSTSWQVQGTGDFDADGDADILWRHSGGSVLTWEIEDHAQSASHNLGALSSAWTLMA
jgi:hypothetical protein